MRSEKEVRQVIEEIEIDYPPGKMVYGSPIGNYNLGVLAGLRMALGEYPTIIEIDMEDFFNTTFPIAFDLRKMLKNDKGIKA